MSDFNIEEELKKVPSSPGVYIMHDKSDTIIYVGKAKSLTKRLHQYFQPSHDEGIKKRQMVSEIDRFEYIVVSSELEALILENNLIKEHRPKYNTLLRDDKTYPYIKVTLEEEYPRVMFSRRAKKDKNRYFGPFTSGDSVRATIDLVNKLFSLRTCSREFPESIGKERPCLNYHMKQCSGVCLGTVSKEEYDRAVKKALDFLGGNYKEEEEALKKKMEEASEKLEFELAAKYRDLIQSIHDCMRRQNVTASSEEDIDIAAISKGAFSENGEPVSEDAVVQIFFIRGGKLIGREHYLLRLSLTNEGESPLGHFLSQYYSGTPFIPKEILIPDEIPEMGLLSEMLSEKKGSSVSIKAPKRGSRARLISLAEKNADLILSKDKERLKAEEGRTIGAVKEIATLLGLSGIVRMEAYDISNTSGFLSVGSMVVFENGRPKRSDYRKFRLRTVEGPNDYASMREVLTRRFLHGKDELERINSNDENAEHLQHSSFVRFPDIIMMDGGKGQVNIALSVLKELDIDIPVAGMVKDDRHRTRGIYFDNKEIPIDRTSEGFKLVTRLQDEAHRFAIEYHRSLRSKNEVHSYLDEIDGIGPARRKALMREFSGYLEMKECSIEDFLKVPEMDRRSAQNLYDYLHIEREKDNGDWS